jgi:geranylgeranyl diphosphate synthase type II
LLVLLAAEACGAPPLQGLPAAVAIELVHTYSLIHDDLPAMDDDALRRGRPTCHVQFDEATAILAGDGLLTLAFEVLSRRLPAAAAAACILELATAAGIEGMVGGQQADLEAESAGPVRDLPELESIHRRKTGRLICAALRMGARIAGAAPEALQRLQVYGESLGLAFQIADDLLDITATAEQLGKQTQKDAGRGKLTYPALLGVDSSRRRAEQLVERAQESVAPWGGAARALQALASYSIDRDR